MQPVNSQEAFQNIIGNHRVGQTAEFFGTHIIYMFYFDTKRHKKINKMFQFKMKQYFFSLKQFWNPFGPLKSLL